MASVDFLGDLKGKTALITGASAGIGAATALQFAKQGIRLALTSRTLEELNNVKLQCVQLGLAEKDVLVVTGDITVREDVIKVAEATLKYFGTVDILINNAGMVSGDTLDDWVPEMMDKMFQQHVKTPIHFIQLLKEEIIKNKGSIVNVASVWGLIPAPTNISYTIAKAAMVQLTGVLNAELGPKGVRCNSMCPGFTMTGLFQNSGVYQTVEDNNKFFEDISYRSTILGRVGRSEEIARGILFLVSDAAPYMIGQHMCIDGGMETANLLSHGFLLKDRNL